MPSVSKRPALRASSPNSGSTPSARLDVGISTSFLVIQAQRDLAQARTSELAATLAYDLALVDFEALQYAGPGDQQSASSAASGSATSLATGVLRSSGGL